MRTKNLQVIKGDFFIYEVEYATGRIIAYIVKSNVQSLQVASGYFNI